MNLSPIQTGLTCQYCKQPTIKINSMEVYGTDYGELLICRPCGAYVGCYGDGTGKGSVAKENLRQARKHAHMWLDPLWKKKHIRTGLSKKQCKDQAYTWISNELGVHFDVTHIGMFDVDQCLKIINLCKPFYKKKKK